MCGAQPHSYASRPCCRAIAAAFAVVVLLKGASGGYTVKARFQNASQLVKGNLVQVSGIRAGTVRRSG